ncbi:MAG: GAF domain-containing protein [Burkholderiales bacterium]|nr:GAF domain-containing protein [Phycisphaerae bacterium]
MTPTAAKTQQRRVTMPRPTRWLAECAIGIGLLLLTAASLARVFGRWTGWEITLTLDAAAAVALLAAVMLRFRDRQRRAYVVALEKLNEAALAIASSPGELEPLLDRLAAVARDLLNMPTSRIMLLSEDHQIFRQVHCFGHTLMAGNYEFPIAQASGAQACLRTGKPVIVENVAQDPGASSPTIAKQLGVGSLLLMPLIAAGEIIGVLALTDSIPRRYTSTQRQLADLLAAHVAVSIANARLYSRMEDAIKSLRRVQAQRDTLYTMSTAVQRARTVEESLARIVELAPSALEIDVCIVCLASEMPSPTSASEPSTLNRGIARPPVGTGFRVAAVTPTPYPFPISAGMLDSCENFSRVVQRCKPMTIELADKDPALRQRGIGSATGVGSVLYMPLVIGGSVAIGVLLLLRRATGSFPEEMVRLAEMFSARAATAIENARLNDQALRDAQTKATLLHELNHRVKNNLSGLIGLLSMGTPPLAPEAQRWLERVIERIGALARAHELFSTGREVRLAELIHTTLDSIAAIKPDDVHVSVDIGNDNDAVLPAINAVPAAMVVYELAYNAIVHGVGEAGKLSVRVRKNSEAQISVEIIDSGGADEAAPVIAARAVATVDMESRPRGATQSRWATALHRGGGVGLSLVRGLVARELRGQFDIRANDQGGTTATVTFPLNRNAQPDRGKPNVGKIASES